MIFVAALTLCAQTAFAQVRALDQLKASSPAGAAAAATAEPSCQPVVAESAPIGEDFTASCMSTSISGMRDHGAAVWTADTKAIAGMCRGAKSDLPGRCFAASVATMRNHGATVWTGDTKAIAGMCRDAMSDRTAQCFATVVAAMRDHGAAIHTGDTQAIAGACKDR